MKCAKFRKLLIPYTEGSLPEELSASIERHLVGCESCARELRSLTCTVDVLKQLDYPAMEPAVDLRSRVLAEITKEPARRPWWQVSRLQAYSGAMAGLLLVAVAGAGMWRMMERRVEIPVASKSTQEHRAEKALPFAETPEMRLAAPQADDTLSKKPAPAAKAERSKEAGKTNGVSAKTKVLSPERNRHDREVNSIGKPARGESLDKTAPGSAGEPKSAGHGVVTEETPSALLDNGASDYVTMKRDSREQIARSLNQAPLGGSQVHLHDPHASPAPAAEAPSIGRLRAKRREGKATGETTDGRFSPASEPPALGNSMYYADGTLDIDIAGLEAKLLGFPTSVVTITNLMVKYREAGRPRDEYKMAQRLTNLDPDNPGYWLSRAQAADRVPMPKTAQVCYQRAIKLGLKGADLEHAQARVKALQKK